MVPANEQVEENISFSSNLNLHPDKRPLPKTPAKTHKLPLQVQFINSLLKSVEFSLNALFVMERKVV